MMLGRFRMTVPDCKFEYENLGQEAFGKPRWMSTIRRLLSGHKYRAARLDKVYKDFAKRRDHEPGEDKTERIIFTSGKGLCST